jgi:antitoxin component YwqK of YwqJK toxin-antitoxin module
MRTIILILFSAFFLNATGQRQVFFSSLNNVTGVFKLNDIPFTGEAIKVNANSQRQIENSIEFIDGVPNGKYKTYYVDNKINPKLFYDSILIRTLNEQILAEETNILNFIKDSLDNFSKLQSLVSEDIGGVKKLNKLEEKNTEGKLKNEDLNLYNSYVGYVNLNKLTLEKINASKSQIEVLNSNLLKENAKPILVQKLLCEYDQTNFIKTGNYISYYENDTVRKSQGYYSKDLQNGFWTYYFSNGNIKAVGEFINGDGTDISDIGVPRNGRSGNWKTYFESGKISQESNWMNGVQNENSIIYYENGHIQEENNWNLGTMNGVRKKYYENGSLQEESNWVNGILNGSLKAYYSNGNPQEVSNWSNGLKNGAFKNYYESGVLKGEGTLKDNKIEGLVKSYFENGNIEYESMFKNDKAHGAFKQYYESGQLKISATIDTNSLAEGKVLGEFFSYKLDGSIESQGVASLDGTIVDKTPKPEFKYSKSELNKTYKCKCCKALINGVYDAVDKDGNEANDLMVTFTLDVYSSPEVLNSMNELSRLYGTEANLTAYDILRDEYKFCSMKCSRTCYE